MSFEEMVVALVGTVAVFGLIGYLSAKTFGLIRAWIDKKNSGIPEEEFDKLARAFMDYKKDTQRRLKNLEAIIADEDFEDETKEEHHQEQIDAPKQSIEIEDSEDDAVQSASNQKNSNLRNMLRE